MFLIRFRNTQNLVQNKNYGVVKIPSLHLNLLKFREQTE